MCVASGMSPWLELVWLCVGVVCLDVGFVGGRFVCWFCGVVGLYIGFVGWWYVCMLGLWGCGILVYWVYVGGRFVCWVCGVLGLYVGFMLVVC